MFRQCDQVRIAFEIDPGQQPELAVGAAPGHLQHPVSAVAISIAGLGVPEFLRHVRVAEAVNPFGDRRLVVRQSCCLSIGNCRRVPVHTEDFNQSLGGIIQAFPCDGQPPRFVQRLCEEVGYSQRRVDSRVLEPAVGPWPLRQDRPAARCSAQSS